MEYFNCGDHPLQLELECPEGVVGVVIVDIAPLRTITARSGVRVQLYIAIGHIGGHCSKRNSHHSYYTKKHSTSNRTNFQEFQVVSQSPYRRVIGCED